MTLLLSYQTEPRGFDMNMASKGIFKPKVAPSTSNIETSNTGP